jgi:intracellular septation protein A
VSEHRPAAVEHEPEHESGRTGPAAPGPAEPLAEEEGGGRTSVRAVVWSVVVDALLPFGIYLGLSALGVPAVAALAAAGGVALVRAIVTWVREREVNALSILLVARFTLGVAAAVLTGDARLVLAKDSLITGAMGLFVLVTLLLAKPFIYHIRRGLSPDRDRWDHWWATSSAFRSVHRRMTWVWGLGLVVDALSRIAVIYTAPLDLAAFVSQALAALSIVALVAWTQWYGRTISVRPDPVPAAG